MGVRPLCIIPARGGSKRFRRKNIAHVGGKPLVAWTIEAAIASGVFEQVWVSSEDDEILAVAERSGGRPLRRAASLAGDAVTVAELCCATVASFAADAEHYDAVYVQLPTSPFRTGATIRRAWREFEESGADALMSVAPLEHPPEWALVARDGWVQPLDAETYEMPRPALEPRYRCDGGHTIVRTDFLLRERAFLGGRTRAFIAPPEERVDIDEPDDLLWAEFLLSRGRATVDVAGVSAPGGENR